jgi:hypothetical protein
VVIVCLFDFQRLDDNESKENGFRSPPRNGDGDQAIKDEDEDYFDFAKPFKPSFETYSKCLVLLLHSTCFK